MISTAQQKCSEVRLSSKAGSFAQGIATCAFEYTASPVEVKTPDSSLAGRSGRDAV
jgi:hypothetical protein